MERARLGTLEWCRASDGRLDESEKLELIRGVAALRAGMLYDDMRSRLGLLRPAPLDLDAMTPPDSRLTRDADALAAEYYDDILRRHCLRTYYFGALVASEDDVPFDAEVLYAAAMCHDLGLNEQAVGPMAGRCFAFSGAELAHSRLLANGHDADVVGQVADAIAAHLNLYVSYETYATECALTAIGATCDVMGAHVRRIAPSTLADVVERWPRAGIIELFAMASSSQHPAGTRPALLVEVGAFGEGGEHPIEQILADSAVRR